MKPKDIIGKNKDCIFVAIVTSKELNIVDRPKLIKKSFLVGEFKNKNKRLKDVVIKKLLINIRMLFPEQENSV